MNVEYVPWVFFIGSLIVSHWLAYRYKWSEGTWDILEYCWLGFAVSMLISVTAEISKLPTEWQLPMQETRLATTRQSASHNAQFYAEYFSKDSIYAGWTVNREQIPQFKALADWCRQIAAVATNDHMKGRWPEFMKGTKEGQIPSDILQVHSGILDNLKIIDDEDDKLQALKSKAEMKPTRNILLLLSAFILPIALALPMTKITAKRKGWISG